ncbi:protein Aster-B-like [Ylistrum balloti]|uniref:protein Aster-B-like n=1 Tax=Ylistrum balloti TaxID=509963 RepID=UPI002905CB95|nr:protein Aster-B-like [Ylistrum balloti]
MLKPLENIDGRDDSLNTHEGNGDSISGNNQHSFSCDSNVNRETKQNFVNGSNNNNNDEDVASTLSVTGAINTLLRRSPQPSLKRKAGEISPVNVASSQESSTSSEPFINIEMNCDSPGRNCSPVYRRTSSPVVKDVEHRSTPSCLSDMHLENNIATDHNKTSNSLDHNIPSDSRSFESRKSQIETPSETSLFGNSLSSSKMTPKVTVSSASSKVTSSPSMCNDKLSVAKSDIERSSSLKGLERASDSGSRSSAEFTRAHSRERSFEKSLDNIMDKCSEKSLDLNLSVECKNGTLSDKTSVDESNVSKKSDKKKKTAPWYTVEQIFTPILNSPSQFLDKKDGNLTGVKISWYTEIYYSCALQKDILVHGRMFLTQNWVCFYANIFRWETVLTIPCKEITAVTKEKTARVIPNAIQIATDKEKHFFTSFGARDKTYMMLFRVWQNALLEQPMSPKELWQWVHYSYGEELGLTSSDDDYVAPPSGIEETVEENSKCENTDSSEAVPIGDIEEVDSPEGLEFTPIDKSPKMGPMELPTDQSDTTDDSEGEVVCTTDHSHFCKEMLYAVYYIPVEKLFDLLYTDTAFIQSVHLSKRNSNLAVSPWQDDTSRTGNRHRTLSYTVALNYSIGPKSSHTFEKQTLYKLSKPGSLYVVDTECSMAGIPYADAFVVVNRFCISRVTHHKSRLRITTEIRYKKSVWGLAKSMIEKNGYQGSEDFFKTLDAHLKREVESLQESNKGSQTQSLKRKLRKRRTRTNPTNMETAALKQTKPTMSRHLSLMDNKTKQSRHTPQAVPPSPIRYIGVWLVLLVIFNAILFYKLWSLEGFATMLYSPHSPAHIDETISPKSQEEWMSVLKQQQYLYEREIDKWKEILSSSITLIDQMKLTLVELRNSLENRLSTKDIYQMHEA